MSSSRFRLRESADPCSSVPIVDASQLESLESLESRESGWIGAAATPAAQASRITLHSVMDLTHTIVFRSKDMAVLSVVR